MSRAQQLAGFVVRQFIDEADGLRYPGRTQPAPHQAAQLLRVRRRFGFQHHRDSHRLPPLFRGHRDCRRIRHRVMG